MEQLFQILAAGSDAATVALALVAWRLDRRLLRLEIIVERSLEEN